MKSSRVTTQMRGLEQYFYVVLFVSMIFSNWKNFGNSNICAVYVTNHWSLSWICFKNRTWNNHNDPWPMQCILCSNGFVYIFTCLLRIVWCENSLLIKYGTVLATLFSLLCSLPSLLFVCYFVLFDFFPFSLLNWSSTLGISEFSWREFLKQEVSS